MARVYAFSIELKISWMSAITQRLIKQCVRSNLAEPEVRMNINFVDLKAQYINIKEDIDRVQKAYAQLSFYQA